MNELSLFSGIGCGIWGTQSLGWQLVGCVEHDTFCCRVLEQRMRDGLFDTAPVWQMDIREFNRKIAPAYTGMVDIITAGFPCQPFSVAGKRAGADDDRNMWPATEDAIRIIRPKFCLLENVPGLLADGGYFGRVLGDLAALGYDAKWGVLSASSVGAPHRRARLWIIANTHADFPRLEERQEPEIRRSSLWKEGEAIGQNDSDATDSEGKQSGWIFRQEFLSTFGRNNTDAANSEGNAKRRLSTRKTTRQSRYKLDYWREPWPEVATRLCRVAHGPASGSIKPECDVSDRRKRLQALGNGQVPQCLVEAWRKLTL